MIHRKRGKGWFIVTTANEMNEHLRLMEAEIAALKESVSLTRSMISNMAMCGKDKDRAEQLIADNQEKIARLQETIERYRN